MTSYDSGEVVLIRYPFTDLTILKKRPAVILSPRIFHERYGDVVVMPLTSQREPLPTLELSQWRAAGLLRPTWVKPIIGTFSTNLIQKRLGTLSDDDVPCVRAALGILLESRWTN
jgi:mRNA interferase MazF